MPTCVRMPTVVTESRRGRVPRVSDLLYRFRPSGAPGAATQAGVPADRARDLAEELEPVFASVAQLRFAAALFLKQLPVPFDDLYPAHAL